MHPYVEFYNQTKRICIALEMAAKYNLGGRDSLIIANFLLNKVSLMYTHDEELLQLNRMQWGNSILEFKDPVKE